MASTSSAERPDSKATDADDVPSAPELVASDSDRHAAATVELTKSTQTPLRIAAPFPRWIELTTQLYSRFADPLLSIRGPGPWSEGLSD